MAKPWGNEEKQAWLKEQTVKRTYAEEVLPQVEKLKHDFEVLRYGALSYDRERFPLFLIKSRNFAKDKKTALITGGVHGYETSGVQGALAFMQREAKNYEDSFNILCVPCISPWGYETINRWNPKTIDPNRNFFPDSPAEECALFIEAMKPYQDKIWAHFDLHETTDTDNTVFRPAKMARDAVEEPLSEIPDGFYLVADSKKPNKDFQKAIIEEVKKATHIAPADSEGRLIGIPLDQEGVVGIDLSKYRLCAGFSRAEFKTTTEVYPDSPKTNPDECVDAQVAAVRGGLEYLVNRM